MPSLFCWDLEIQKSRPTSRCFLGFSGVKAGSDNRYLVPAAQLPCSLTWLQTKQDARSRRCSKKKCSFLLFLFFFSLSSKSTKQSHCSKSKGKSASLLWPPLHAQLGGLGAHRAHPAAQLSHLFSAAALPTCTPSLPPAKALQSTFSDLRSTHFSE